jgi:hypothetical protein
MGKNDATGNLDSPDLVNPNGPGLWPRSSDLPVLAKANADNVVAGRHSRQYEQMSVPLCTEYLNPIQVGLASWPV